MKPSSEPRPASIASISAAIRDLRLLVRARGGERGGLALEDAPHLEELAVVGLLDGERGSPSELLSVLPNSATRKLPFAAAPDHALRLEHAQGLADRGAADPVELDELALRGMRVARPEPARADEPEQPLRDDLVRLLPRDRLEEGVVRQADQDHYRNRRAPQVGRGGAAWDIS